MGSNTIKQVVSEEMIKAIVFFDLFDFPLTPLEVLTEVNRQWSLSEVRNSLLSDHRLEEKDGFFFLTGRSEIVSVRRQRHNYARRKIKIAQRFVSLFSFLPWVQSISLANVIGFNNLRDGSDIDFFIITAPGRLWLSRLYCTGLAKLLGRRPTPGNKRDRICLSFYLSSSRLDIRSMRLKEGDPYFDYWRRHLVLLYNKDDVFSRFLAANKLSVPVNTDKQTVSLYLGEKIARFYQMKIMPTALKEAAGRSEGVVISDFVLKFYQRDRRREFAYKYAQKIKAIN